ncbi:hypothetical protein DSM107007_56730 [Nostoc sp. PCC 7120 = FACHB-418]|nr:hypothetical protein DSM107007_56730 [Nostoc sp. PCC 7120 = FACHB-418]
MVQITAKIITQSTLREPSGEELEIRRLEAERLLPLVEEKAEAEKIMQNEI